MSFKIRRKTDDDDVETQDARSTNVQVPLNQHIYNSFVIKDGEASKSFQELVAIYLLPAMQVIARGVDRAVLGQVHKLLAGPAVRVGRLLNLDEDNSKDYLLEARKVLNDNKAPVTARNLVLGSASETALLKNELFIAADQRGDGGTALEDARLGRILGFDTWMDQNVNDIAEGTSDVAIGTVTNAAGIGATGSQAVAITGYEAQAGDGNLTYTENSEYEYELDRGQLDTVREGNQVPMDVNLDFVYEFVTTGTGEAITPMDATKGGGGAAEWVSSSADPCAPYAVDVEVEHIPPCGGADMEISIFPDFRADSKEFDLGEATVSVSGRCNAVEPTISRVSQ